MDFKDLNRRLDNHWILDVVWFFTKILLLGVLIAALCGAFVFAGVGIVRLLLWLMA